MTIRAGLPSHAMSIPKFGCKPILVVAEGYFCAARLTSDKASFILVGTSSISGGGRARWLFLRRIVATVVRRTLFPFEGIPEIESENETKNEIKKTNDGDCGTATGVGEEDGLRIVSWLAEEGDMKSTWESCWTWVVSKNGIEKQTSLLFS